MKSLAKVFTLPVTDDQLVKGVLSGDHSIVIAPSDGGRGSLIVVGDTNLATRIIASGPKIQLKKVTHKGELSWLADDEHSPMDSVPCLSQILES